VNWRIALRVAEVQAGDMRVIASSKAAARRDGHARAHRGQRGDAAARDLAPSSDRLGGIAKRAGCQRRRRDRS
jgi:hypothetical protein